MRRALSCGNSRKQPPKPSAAPHSTLGVFGGFPWLFLVGIITVETFRHEAASRHRKYRPLTDVGHPHATLTLTRPPPLLCLERIVLPPESARGCGSCVFSSLIKTSGWWIRGVGAGEQLARSNTRICYCQELRYAFAVFKSAVLKPSLKRSYTDCRRPRALAVRP
jgi:hypothetical protein